MALLKDLIVQGASRFIGDAYFATIKAGVWNGTPIDLSHGGTAGTTTANQVLLSTSTSGTSTWGAQSSLSVGSASRLSGTSSYTAWGQTYWSNGVPSTISGDMTSVGNITPSANASKDCGSSSNAWLNVYGNNIVSNTTLYLASATSTSLIFKPQGTERARFNTSGNLIIGLTNSTTPVANDITDLKLYVDGATTITGTLTLSKTQDLAGTANNSPALIIGGPATGVHMEIDSNEIHAKATSTTVAPLYLNNEGGLVYARGKVLAELDATTTTAGLVFVSTTTEGRGEWKAASNVTSGNATYAANVGAAGTLHTNYVTAAEVIAVYNWYSTMIDENNDSDIVINRWREVCDFLNNFTEADTLASVLSTYVTLGTAQTITGAKTFSNPISGDLLGNATTADRLKSTTAVGGAGTPVYFTGGLPVACTAANVRTFLGLGTVYSHAHTDYVTNVSYNSSTGMLLQSKGGATATDVVNVTNVYLSRTNSTESYRPLVYGLAYGAYNNESLYAALIGQVYTSNTISAKTGPGYLYVAGNISINENPDTYGATNKLFVNGSACIADSTYANLLEIWRKADNSFSCIRYSNGTTKTVLGHIGIASSSGTLVAANRPYWSTGDSSVYYQIVHSTGAVGGSTTAPVYIDSNGQAQVCTSLNINTSGTAAGLSATIANNRLPARLQNYHTTNTDSPTECGWYYASTGSNGAPFGNTDFLIMAQGYSSSWGSEIATEFRSNRLFVRNKNNGTWNSWNEMVGTLNNQTISGNKTFSGATTIDSLTAGSLIVTGASSLTGNVSMGTVTAGTWNGSVIDVAHGGTGLATLTSGSALIGNGTGAVTFKAIDTTVTANSSNLITSGAVATYVTSTLNLSAVITKTAITKSLNSSTWTETGYTLYGESQGSYMLQITDTTTSAVFTGVFSVYNSSSATGNDLDEIPLHMCASATNKVRIYAATLNGKLLVSSQDASATSHTLTIKYRKLI